MNVLKVFGHIECNTIYHFSRSVVDKFKFDVLKLFAYEFACAVIIYAFGAENRLVIPRTEGIEFL